MQSANTTQPERQTDRPTELPKPIVSREGRRTGVTVSVSPATAIYDLLTSLQKLSSKVHDPQMLCNWRRQRLQVGILKIVSIFIQSGALNLLESIKLKCELVVEVSFELTDTYLIDTLSIAHF